MKKTKSIALLMTFAVLFSAMPLPVLAETGEEEEMLLAEETLWETGDKEETFLLEEQQESEEPETPVPGEESKLPEEEETSVSEKDPKEKETPAPEKDPITEEGETSASEKDPKEEEASAPEEELTEDGDFDFSMDEGWEEFIEALPEPEGLDWNDDLLWLAESLIGEGEIEDLSAESEDGEMLFYTRFGAWMGLPYDPWCASFVSFCLFYAGIPSGAVPLEANCEDWYTELSEKELFTAAENEEGEAFIPEPGDLVFFADSSFGTPCHVGIVRDYISAEYDEEGKMIHNDLLLTVEGNNGPEVAEFEYERGMGDGFSWIGFVSLHAARERWEWEQIPEEEVQAHTAEAEENLCVFPMLEEENTVLWLIAVHEEPMAFGMYTWDGEPMLWSEAHNAWVSCVRSPEEPAAGKLSEVPGEGEALESDADLNGTGQEDLNDVQYLYSICRTSGAAGELPRELCLRCDLNGDGVIDLEDVQELLLRITE